MFMIRLTLPDGTRLQLEAFEITDVEPVPGGSLIHRATGDPIKVMQDARTIQTRLNAELDSAATENEPNDASAAVEDEMPMPAGDAEHPAARPAGNLVVAPTTRLQKLKRMMQGRVSGLAMTIAQTGKG